MAAKKGTATEEKLAIFAEAESSSTTKISVCRKYGILKSTLDYWRKQLLNTKNNPENEIARLRKDISEVPKSTFFYKPHEEKPDLKRGCTKPGYSRTFNGELISDEAIAMLLFDLAEEYSG